MDMQRDLYKVATDFVHYPAKLHTQKFKHNAAPSNAKFPPNTEFAQPLFCEPFRTPPRTYLYERTSGHWLKIFRVLKSLLACNNCNALLYDCPPAVDFFPSSSVSLSLSVGLSLSLSLMFKNVKTLSTHWNSEFPYSWGHGCCDDVRYTRAGYSVVCWPPSRAVFFLVKMFHSHTCIKTALIKRLNPST